MKTHRLGAALALLMCSGLLTPAGGPRANAPVKIHLDGICEVVKGSEAKPLEIGVGPTGSVRRGKLAYLTASFRADGPKEKAASKPDARALLGADRLTVEFVFPHEDAKAHPLRVKGYLQPDACCGTELEGFVTVPEKASLGKVKLMISWAEGKKFSGDSVTLNVVIGN